MPAREHIADRFLLIGRGRDRQHLNWELRLPRLPARRFRAPAFFQLERLIDVVKFDGSGPTSSDCFFRAPCMLLRPERRDVSSNAARNGKGMHVCLRPQTLHKKNQVATREENE